MSLPPFVSAEAAVKSHRTGYQSPFDSAADISPGTIKQFYSDANLVRDAVDRFKKKGFTVVSVGRFSVSIAGPPDLFEVTFGITLVVQSTDDDTPGGLTVEGSSRIGFIDTTTSEFDDILAGIAINPPVWGLFISADPPAKMEPWHLSLSEIRPTLGGADVRETGRDVHIVVPDTGMFKDHPYFSASLNADRVVIRDSKALREILRDRRRRKQQFDTLIEHLDTVLQRGQPPGNRLIEDFEGDELREVVGRLTEGLRTLLSSDTVVRAIDKIMRKNNPAKDRLADQLENGRRFLKIERREFHRHYVEPLENDDIHGHGTNVVAHLLSTVPDVEVTVLKDEFALENIPGSVESSLVRSAAAEFREAVSLNPDIISISNGIFSKKPDDEVFNAYKAEVLRGIRNGITVLFGAGNLGSGNSKESVSVEARWNGVIAVGGVFFRDGRFEASDYAHGYSERGLIIPTVCGLCGPTVPEDSDRNGDYIWAPGAEEKDGPNPGWRLGTGTSQATPQVAGVCAMIKQIWRQAEPSEVRQLVRDVVDEVSEGSTVQNFPASALHMRVVNIGKAVAEARLLGGQHAKRELSGNGGEVDDV